MRIKILLLITGLSLIANVVFGYGILKNGEPKKNFSEQSPYLSKRIFAEDQNDILINFIPLRADLKEYIGKQESIIGLYFEYLPSGSSIGINEKKEIILASLSKIPVVMAILKKIEQRQLSLDDTLVINKENLNQEFGNLWKQGEGARLSVGELIKLTLTESDNTATNVLLSQLKGPELNEIYKNLDIPLIIKPEDENKNVYISIKNYASILRSLYLSSSLIQESSNYILNILTQSIFKDKIPAGVPNTIKVAHKIGVFEEPDVSQFTFTDCGIVYVPSRPYILCAFVQDSNDQAKKHISYISKLIYEYVSKVNK